MPYEKVEGKGGFFGWDVIGKVYEGTYLSIGEGEYQGRKTFHAKFKNASGAVERVDTPTILLRRLRDEFASGDRLRITFIGTVKGKQPVPAKNFDIEIDREASSAPEVPVSAPAATSDAVEAAYAKLLAKHPSAAPAIRKSLEAFVKGDLAQMATLLEQSASA